MYCIVERSIGDYFYVLAADNDTHVQVSDREPFTLQEGESRQLIISSMEHAAIRSDKSILVVQVNMMFIGSQ